MWINDKSWLCIERIETSAICTLTGLNYRIILTTSTAPTLMKTRPCFFLKSTPSWPARCFSFSHYAVLAERCESYISLTTLYIPRHENMLSRNPSSTVRCSGFSQKVSEGRKVTEETQALRLSASQERKVSEQKKVPEGINAVQPILKFELVCWCTFSDQVRRSSHRSCAAS